MAKQLGLSATGDAELTGAALSSRHIRPGYLFIAAPGKNSHGLEYLHEAIEQGAVALQTSQGDFELSRKP
ncbi:MAG: Mur ligase domain-containing protein, partial [Aquiluna sp.]